MMKKKTKMMTGALALSLVTGAGAYSYTAHAANSNSSVDEEEAVSKALENESGTPVSFETDKENGKEFYEVSLQGKENESEVTIQTDTGKVVSVEKEALEKDDAVSSPKIDLMEAARIAQKEGKGTLSEIELDNESGKLLYEAEVKTKTKKTELAIDANTGKVISMESEAADKDED
ncbi:PepSY domain-containing protein [Fictibacillus fluitans]|uniref:PepSY domain-containing protein n=1 Tax=Fictibacillus fluitans TaxID=3058422 RepID=A0ABT8HY80_9BACL|nr:PepSY domain-containing protein [Fictibacillus sp. NE201]MDN4525736.1 PepSY domain-containing protein [Fictibacillus sp. NE201]